MASAGGNEAAPREGEWCRCQAKLLRLALARGRAAQDLDRLERLVQFLESGRPDAECGELALSIALGERDISLLHYAVASLALRPLDPAGTIFRLCEAGWKEGAELLVAQLNFRLQARDLCFFLPLLAKPEISEWLVGRLFATLPAAGTPGDVLRAACRTNNPELIKAVLRSLRLRAEDIHKLNDPLFFDICLDSDIQTAQWVVDSLDIELFPQERAHFFFAALARNKLPLLEWAARRFAYRPEEVRDDPRAPGALAGASREVREWFARFVAPASARAASPIIRALRPDLAGSPEEPTRGDGAAAQTTPIGDVLSARADGYRQAKLKSGGGMGVSAAHDLCKLLETLCSAKVAARSCEVTAADRDAINAFLEERVFVPQRENAATAPPAGSAASGELTASDREALHAYLKEHVFSPPARAPAAGSEDDNGSKSATASEHEALDSHVEENDVASGGAAGEAHGDDVSAQRALLEDWWGTAGPDGSPFAPDPFARSLEEIANIALDREAAALVAKMEELAPLFAALRAEPNPRPEGQVLYLVLLASDSLIPLNLAHQYTRLRLANPELFLKKACENHLVEVARSLARAYDIPTSSLVGDEGFVQRLREKLCAAPAEAERRKYAEILAWLMGGR
jgi:hypothetical protein